MKIEDKICVRKPYYALEELEVFEGGAKAEVRIENLESSESTIISMSEAGRHLAILGSYALAGVNDLDEMCYYLTNKAYVLSSDSVALIAGKRKSTKLYLEAKVISLDLRKKSGSVETRIMDVNGIE